MKIGIVTLQLHTNYGGVLQAFALQQALVRMGNDVEIIQLDNPCSKRNHGCAEISDEGVPEICAASRRRRDIP